MNAPTKFHPLTGEALKPIFTSEKTGRVYWPIMGGSETIPEGVVTPEGTVTIPVQPDPAPAPQTFTAEQIAKARQEEKDKLYPEIQSLKEKQAQFEAFKAEAEAQRQAAVEEAAAKAREEAEAEARKKFEESDAKSLLAEAEQKWQSQFEALQQERATEHALFEREREFAALKEYATGKVNEALQANELAPELADFVTGNTQEEIDASLEFVKQKTQQIVAGIQQAQTAARAAMPGVSTAGFAATGPLDTQPGQKTFTAEELANMPISEYAKHRQALLGAAASTQQNRGLYG
jgi:hypothetical protein